MDFEERAYMSDPYRVEFTAKVRKVEPDEQGQSAVYLDRTYFYPESGGQPEDRGTLGGKAVVSVTEDDEGVRHLVAGTLAPGKEVEGKIDSARRFDHMQQHSGQHLLSRVLFERLGGRTIGFHLGEKESTIDLDIEVPAEDDAADVEMKVNLLIWKNIPISDRVVGREEYEKLQRDAAGTPAEEIRSRLPEGTERVRIIEIDTIDSSTCCGTHCRTTGEIGMVKLLGWERIRQTARVSFVCGSRAYIDYAEKHDLLKNLGLVFSSDWRELADRVPEMFEMVKRLGKDRKELIKRLSGYMAAELAVPTDTVKDLDLVKRLFKRDETDIDLKSTAQHIQKMENKIVLFANDVGEFVFACSDGIPINMGEVLKNSITAAGGRGGGGPTFAQGGGGDGAKITDALDEAERLVREALE
jgi:alanyl-tRNA synthetase